jgi:hypothetical protein
MNFIGAVLRTVDVFWTLILIPCVMIAGLLFINAFPIPTALVFYGAIWMILEIGRLDALNSRTQEEATASRAESVAWASVVFVAAVASYGLCAYLQVTNPMACQHLSGIPLAYDQILKFLSVLDC